MSVKEEPDVKPPFLWIDYVGNGYRPDEGETRMQLVQSKIFASIADSLVRIANSLESKN